MKKILFSITILLLISSCATTSNRHREGSNVGQETDITVADEQKMTRDMLPKLRKEYPPVKNPWLQSYVNRIGQKLIKKSNLHGKPYTYNFTVVNVNYVNAFALPAGTIYVTAPLIAMTDSEAELAGVIGHEIGHVIARHAAERIDKEKKSQGQKWLQTAGGGLLGGVAGYGLGKLLCKKGDKKCLTKAAGYGLMAGAGGTLLIQKYSFMANSREDEMEADRIGFNIATKGGYAKDEIGRFYKKLLAMEKKSKRRSSGITKAFADAMSTHPPSAERVTQMDEMARRHPSQKQATSVTKDYLKAKKQVKK